MASETQGETSPFYEGQIGTRQNPQRRAKFTPEHRILLDILIQARSAAHLTQTQLAAKLNKAQSHVAYVEKGDRDLYAVEVLRWCEACGLSFVDFAKKVEDELRTHRLNSLSNEPSSQPSE